MSYQVMPPKPTRYKGRQYRSRLEARWAAFFDLLGVNHEYEPFDLDGWSPDFELEGKYNVIVEIKPLSMWTQGLIDKIRKHAESYTCLLLHERIYYVDYEVFIGKQVMPPGSDLILKDFMIAGDVYQISPLWVESANKAMFLKPFNSVTNEEDFLFFP